MAAIDAATAATVYVSNDRVRRPMQISSLRGIDKDCVCAIDGTHVPCTPIGAHNLAAYQNTNDVNSRAILAACSFDMKFTYILSGWEGSAHDARVLTDALNNPRFQFPHPPPDPNNDDEFDDDDNDGNVSEGPIVTAGSVHHTEIGF
ncbi:uncharacterized protein LOC112093522 [Morus notabilis]|uniref:uncharacterized protein LOC112093522 n=1 Tax=Morus notabilis TaxID=981085 RepID=UPI000CED7607|nr:uncharacterized protein LOC112093522 [Morus notabilis]